MDNSGWFTQKVYQSKIAMPYGYSDSIGLYQPLGYGGFPDYPAGSLHADIEQFAHFLIVSTQQGKWDGKQVFADSIFHNYEFYNRFGSL